MMKIGPYGLSDQIEKWLRGVFAKYPHLDHVDMYGSRARGDFKPSSDIDLAAFGGPDFSQRDFSNLRWDIDALPIVFKIDLVDMNRLTNDKLAASIKRDGVRFWPLQNSTTH